jgi:hypothetical protein
MISKLVSTAKIYKNRSNEISTVETHMVLDKD